MHLEFDNARNRSTVGNKVLQYIWYNLEILNEIVTSEVEGLNPAGIQMVSAEYGTPWTKEK